MTTGRPPGENWANHGPSSTFGVAEHEVHEALDGGVGYDQAHRQLLAACAQVHATLALCEAVEGLLHHLQFVADEELR